MPGALWLFTGLVVLLKHPLAINWGKDQSETLRTEVTLEMLLWDQAMRLELSLVLDPRVCVLFLAVIQMFCCCLQPCLCCHISVMLLFCCWSSQSDFEPPPPIVSFHSKTSVQACCSVHIGDSFCFSCWATLSQVSFASGLLCMSSPTPLRLSVDTPPISLSICGLGGADVMPWLWCASSGLRKLCKLMTYCMCTLYVSYLSY